jgi:hypothetical protein
MPAPVIVMKDVGGLVTDYQSQTELYRASDREVRLHECRSACTLALSLPNVCVYPDSTLKFHLAYDPRNRQTDANVSQQLFDSYPPAVRARLGGLTRDYKVLRGSELIALGVRDCTGQRVMVASAAPRKAPPARIEAPSPPAEQGSLFGGLMRNMLAAFGGSSERTDVARSVPTAAPAAKPASSEALPAVPPLPPARPAEFAALEGAPPAKDALEAARQLAPSGAPAPDAQTEVQAANVPAPPPRPKSLAFSYQRRLTPAPLPKIITGAQPILPPGFRGYAEFGR